MASPAAASSTGKVALISGGSRGQGAAEARLLAEAGPAVAICDVLDEEGRVLAAGIGAAARFIHLDVTLPEGWAAAEVHGWRGRLDTLVNNAGLTNRATIATTSIGAWNRLLAVDLTGVFLGVQSATPVMRAAGGGATVNIASRAGFTGHTDPAYTASAWPLRGLTRTAAMEFVADRIRVNSVCPGLSAPILSSPGRMRTPPTRSR